ncbi:junctional protein associated with coronary artery disease [Perognathus longimembris pacificus]|uniref:junctional protein associated with coronary artery disease n=1 Tax=Perognathus longimembris pacificus TaxID=214514 RepID=UPI0020198B7B|nr:junctional protein associated with coronary artery disease [Perognathus longimembris pacificus]XP_048223506.1 junctional protein associated with coronary artery disease [Perognathus longimembris pacificus]XP_048223507.1 junctional protein associated with coronary artery disease [Perognathus longimembris pacificus]
MYSVEDLLISHGYKPSRDLPGPREENPKGRRQARSRTRAEHDLLNGYGDDPAAFAHGQTAQGKRPVSDAESRRSTPGGRGDQPAASASRTPEAGLYSRPTLAWSSKPQVGSDHAYRRRGQEVSDVPGSRDREAQELRGTARAQGPRQGPWEVGGRTEQVTQKAAWEEELRMPGPAKWPSAGSESWNESRKLGRHMSDGDGEKLFQDLYPFTQEEHGPISQNQRKSRSLPRVLSPESLAGTEIPIPIKDSHASGVPRTPPHPSSYAPHLETPRNPEKGAAPAPFPRPKFGRPVKPPSYSSYQPPRAGESSGFQESDPYSYLTKSNDPRHDLGVPDAGLEPPVYVPPPSYKSPPQHIPNPYLEDTEPTNVSDSHRRQQQYGADKDGARCWLPPGPGGAGSTQGSGSPGSPRGLSSRPHPGAAYEGGVQYIPFDDPRIRHIKLAQPPGLREDLKLHHRQHGPGPAGAPEPARGKTQPNGVPPPSRGLAPPSDAERGQASSHPNPQRLRGLLPRDGEHGGLADPREQSVARGHPESQASPHNPQGEDTCKSQTKLRKFESGIQTKKSSKKKTNETIFCLVSIPVKSEPHLPDTDTNNNDLKSPAAGKPGLDKSSALPEQSLLSMSPTDLELQALTGSVAGKLVFLKQELEELEDEPARDLKFVYLAQHRELKCPGSWPGHQYRDQQTQTSFPEEAKGPGRLPAPDRGAPRSPAATPPLEPPEAPSSDQAQTLDAPDPRGQPSLSPSSSSAFSRTPLSRNQAAPSQACVDACARDRGRAAARPPAGPQVVRGEPTAARCNSKQPFGQFLLKPVSRRPWDLISQLESFNKELQEEEQSDSSESSESSEADPPPPREQVPPGEGWERGIWSAARGFSSPTRADGGGGDPWQWAEAAVNGPSRLAASPGPAETRAASPPRARSPAGPAHLAGREEPPQDLQLSKGPGAGPPGRGVPPKGERHGERDAVAPLSVTHKTRGLSAPDLRSTGLSAGQERSAAEPDGASGGGGAVEIPPSESLQARAERILGIEVAVESLLPGPQPDPSACSSDLPAAPWEAPTPGGPPPGQPRVTPDAFYGRRKCGWTESPLFVGERAPQASEHSGAGRAPAGQATSPEPPPSSMEPQTMEEKDPGVRPPFRSTLFHFVERTPNAAGSEKRLRSPSKVIESLQEKLASPPRRVAPDRLMRMKEVSSVSRMRCLSFQNSDSTEEAEDPKASRGQAWQPGDLVSPSSEDLAWRVGYPPSVSKGFTPPEENGHLPTLRREKNVESDFWCPESYDPSRVERV